MAIQPPQRFQLDDLTHVEREARTIYAPGATPGDVLVVQSDHSLVAAPGGGSQPVVAWRGPFICNFSDWVPDFFGSDPPIGAIPVAYDAPDGTQVFRYVINVTDKFLYDAEGTPTVPQVDLGFFQSDDQPDYAAPGGLAVASNDPADWQNIWASLNAGGADQIAGRIDNDTYGSVMFSTSPFKPGAILKLGGAMGVALHLFNGPPTQGHARIWLETFEPPA